MSGLARERQGLLCSRPPISCYRATTILNSGVNEMSLTSELVPELENEEEFLLRWKCL